MVRRVEGVEDLLDAVDVLARADFLVRVDLRLRTGAVDARCFAPTTRIDPHVVNGMPTNPAWLERDALNQYCATLQLEPAPP